MRTITNKKGENMAENEQGQAGQGQGMSIEQGDATANQLFTKALAIKQDVVNTLKMSLDNAIKNNEQLRGVIDSLQGNKSGVEITKS